MTKVLRETITRSDMDRINQSNRYNSTANYVAALPVKRQPTAIEIMPSYQVDHSLNTPLSAIQHVDMRTSAVDRSKGFLLASVPLYAAFALGVVLMMVLFTGYPFFSFWAFSVFWLSFVLAWAWGYRETLMKSAEGVAFFEAKAKWRIIEREQDRRWEHYERLTRGDE